MNSGDPSHVSHLLECFKKDARSVKLRAGTNRLEDVTETLKYFLSEIDDALLTKQLYPFWISALGNTLHSCFEAVGISVGYHYCFFLKNQTLRFCHWPRKRTPMGLCSSGLALILNNCAC